MSTKLLSLLTVCLIAVGFVACDVTGEQNYDFEVGETLSIEGPAEVVIPKGEASVTESYYVKAFTIKKEYEWSVEGVGVQDSVYREGEFIDITFNESGTTTIKVDNSDYEGTLKVESIEEE